MKINCIRLYKFHFISFQISFHFKPILSGHAVDRLRIPTSLAVSVYLVGLQLDLLYIYLFIYVFPLVLIGLNSPLILFYFIKINLMSELFSLPIITNTLT